ncbi:MAG: hypothetical protein HYU97_04905 [Deltaproteobacteria bacterium]|nr:hypothetical protein [Deltaproteobacteria bacterium]
MAEPTKFKAGDTARIEFTNSLGELEIVAGTIVEKQGCEKDPNNKGLAWKSNYKGSSPVCVGPDGITAQALTKVVEGTK